MVSRNPNPGKKDFARMFARRKAGIMKKAEELSVLCGGSVAVVIFEPDNGSPHVWHPCPETLNSTIDRFLKKKNPKSPTTVSDGENQSAYDHAIDGLSSEQLFDLVGYLNAKINLLNSRIDMLKGAQLVDDQQLQMMMMMMMMMNNRVQYEENHNPLPLNYLGVPDCGYGGGSNSDSSNFVGGSNIDCGYGGVPEFVGAVFAPNLTIY